MKKNNIKLIGVFASILLLAIVITSSFAYFGSFNVNLTNNVAVNVNSVSPGDATFTLNATQLNLQVPAANMSQTNAGTLASEANATLTVELTGAANLATTCTYDVVYEYDANSNVYGTSPTTKNGDKEITIQVESPNGTNNFSTEKNFDSSSISLYNKSGKIYTLVSGVSITSEGTKISQDIKITAKYYNLDTSQDNLAGKAFTGKIYAVKNKCETKEIEYASATILKNNGGETAIKSKGNPDFTTSATTNEGMYAMEDDFGTSYYFRGAVDNNWVKFGKDSSGNDIYWRIIRINGDGSIRMIYSGITAPTESTKVVMTGEGTQIGTSAFDGDYSISPIQVGYMNSNNEQHGISTDSTIKTFIDNWYKITILETDASTKKLVADSIFCNDRNIDSGTWSLSEKQIFYAPYTRIRTNSSPSLKCTNISDRFTVNSSNGNGVLTYPVGLIAADEIFVAGSDNQDNNLNYYLYTNNFFWSISPSYYTDLTFKYETHVYSINNNGKLDVSLVEKSYGVRPVINLSPSVKLSGSVTYDDVYTVS